MKITGCVLFAFMLLGCSTAKVRNLETDAQLRIFLDPRIPVEHYTKIRSELVRSGRFEVVERSETFQALLAEQELQHGRMGRRFNDADKYAWIAQFYGAAAIVTGSAECYNRNNFWGHYVKECKQDLALINGSTGKVEIEVSGKNAEEAVVGFSVPDWHDTVVALVDAYPKYFKPQVIQEPLATYRDQSAERAKREREYRLTEDVDRKTAALPPSAAAGLEEIKKAHEEYVKESKSTDEPSYKDGNR
jgi:hypothetical protein